MRVRSWFLIGVASLLYNCDNEPGTLGLEHGVMDNNYGIVLIDTISVHVSTVLLDSIPTSNTGSILVGGYQDEELGTIQTEGFLQAGLGAAWEPSTAATFDSIVLVANYSGYYYGDTTISQSFEVNRVNQAFKPYDLPQFYVDERQYSALYRAGSLYNTSTMRSDKSPLGHITKRLSPGRVDSLVIRLDDNLGREWLQLAKDKSPIITDQEQFGVYFYGLRISNVSENPSCVVGFLTDNVKIRLYYKQYQNEMLQQQFQEFPVGGDFYNYTKISADRAGTVLENLTVENNEISTAETGEMAFIQSGVGLVTKVKFPYIKKMLDLQTLLIVNSAQLVIEPIKNSFGGDYPLPQTLTLFETDKTNLPLAQAFADYRTDIYQSAYISNDKEFNTSTGYIFNITEYIQNFLSTEGNIEKGFLIMPPPGEINQTVNRAYLGAGRGISYKVRLKVWYTAKQ